jgi:hypothetical protein
LIRCVADKQAQSARDGVANGFRNIALQLEETAVCNRKQDGRILAHGSTPNKSKRTQYNN